ncbi:hypothetical protein E6C60_0121 [Paenibacillus algicola]|uniref:Uncharacterized protein n=1 Tax=Paenibacillus algicola TaxID=2565926 RepID=A0A4P8XFB0_9BACL|nr:hypothetical protein E6C60_0121 [Paenibacillus algicola]
MISNISITNLSKTYLLSKIKFLSCCSAQAFTKKEKAASAMKP